MALPQTAEPALPKPAQVVILPLINRLPIAAQPEAMVGLSPQAATAVIKYAVNARLKLVLHMDIWINN